MSILAREGLPPVAYEAARNMIGGGARRMIEAGWRPRPAANDRGGRPARWRISSPTTPRISPITRGRFRGWKRRSTNSPPGCRFAVCTNKLEWLSPRLLDALGLTPRFAAICGQDTFGVQKPRPEPLLRTVERLRGQLSQTVMVGDSVNDIATARAAGIPVVAVDFGYSETPIREFAPDRVIGGFAHLPEAVFDLLKQKSKSGGPWHLSRN